MIRTLRKTSLRALAASVLVLSLFATIHAGASVPDIASANVLVVDDATGTFLLQKDAYSSVPMASLTKLVTAMVILDAAQDLAEQISITDADLDRIKFTSRGLPLGTSMTRRHLLELALLSSDNRAASALARSFPGGLRGFAYAAALKATQLRLKHTIVVEPTGLSPRNQSSALDMAIVLRAAARYPIIQASTSVPAIQLMVHGHLKAVPNTNRLVGRDGWDILLSKTGFTDEAGRCLAMRVKEAGRVFLVVLLGGPDSASRELDATNIRRFLRGLPSQPRATARSPSPSTTAAMQSTPT